MSEKPKRKRKPQDYRRYIVALVALVTLAVGALLPFAIVDESNSAADAYVAYRYPVDDSAPPDVWRLPVKSSAEPERITSSETGVIAFDVNQSGTRYVYTENVPEPEIMLKQAGDAPVALTDCAGADVYCGLIGMTGDGNFVVYTQRHEPSLEPGQPPRLTLHAIDITGFDDGTLIPDTKQLLPNRDLAGSLVYGMEGEHVLLGLNNGEIIGVDVTTGALVRDIIALQSQLLYIESGCVLPSNVKVERYDPHPVLNSVVLDLSSDEIWLCDPTTGDLSRIQSAADSVKWTEKPA